MICVKCKNEIQEGFRFCGNCGFMVQEQQINQQPIYQQQMNQQAMYQQPMMQQQINGYYNVNMYQFMDTQRKLDELSRKIEAKDNMSKIKKIIALVVFTIVVIIEIFIMFNDLNPLLEEQDEYYSDWLQTFVAGGDVDYDYLEDEINTEIFKMVLIGAPGGVTVIALLLSADKDKRDYWKYENEQKAMFRQLNGMQ